jgi:hypothetical protein
MPREAEVKPKKEKKEKKEKEDKEDKPKKEKKASSSQVPQKQRGPLPGKKDEGNYLDDMDLPSSGSDEEEHERSARAGVAEPAVAMPTIDAREAKKIADKERIAMEKLHQMKIEALKVKACDSTIQ